MDSLRHFITVESIKPGGKKSNPEWEALLVMTDGCTSQEIVNHGLIKRHIA